MTLTEDHIIKSILALLTNELNLNIEFHKIFYPHNVVLSDNASVIKTEGEYLLCVFFSLDEKMINSVGKVIIPEGYSKDETDKMYSELSNEISNLIMGCVFRIFFKGTSSISMSHPVNIKKEMHYLFESTIKMLRFQTNLGYIDFAIINNEEICAKC